MKNELIVELIQNYLKITNSTKHSCYMKGRIPDGLAQKAIASYASELNLHDILAIIDTSAFKNGSDGYLFTAEALYMKEGWNDTAQIKFAEIDSVELVNRYIEGYPNQAAALNFLLHDGSVIRWPGFALDNHEAFADLVRHIVEVKEKNSTNQCMEEISNNDFVCQEKNFLTLHGEKQILNQYKEFLAGGLMLDNIPERRLQNAVSTIAPSINRGDVIGMMDFTVFSSGKRGILFTLQGVYMLGITAKYPVNFLYKDIAYVRAAPLNPKYFYKDSDKVLVAYLKDGSYLVLDSLGICNKTPLAWMLMELGGIIEPVSRDDISGFLITDKEEMIAKQEAFLCKIEAKIENLSEYLEKERRRMEKR